MRPRRFLLVHRQLLFRAIRDQQGLKADFTQPPRPCFVVLDQRGRLWLRAFNDICARAVEHLRLTCIELQMAPTRTVVHTGMDLCIGVAREDKNLSGYDHLNESADATLNELARQVHASKASCEEAVGSVGAKR